MVLKGNIKMGGMEADNPKDRALSTLATLMKSGYKLDQAERDFVLAAAKGDGMELKQWLQAGEDPAMTGFPGGHDKNIPYPDERGNGYQHATYRAGGYEQEGSPGGASRYGDAARMAEVRAGSPHGASGGSAGPMYREYGHEDRQLPGVQAANDLSQMLAQVGEIGRSVKALNATFAALLAKAEEHNEAEDKEEEEEERARPMRPAVESRDDEDEDSTNQNRWASGKNNLADVLAGKAVLEGNLQAVMTAMAGKGDWSQMPARGLFKSDWIAAKSRAIQGADLSLQEELEASSLLAMAQAVSHGATTPAMFRMRLSTASDAVKRLFS